MDKVCILPRVPGCGVVVRDSALGGKDAVVVSEGQDFELGSNVLSIDHNHAGWCLVSAGGVEVVDVDGESAEYVAGRYFLAKPGMYMMGMS